MNKEDSSFFAAFTEKARQRLLDVTTCETHPDGVILFKEGDASDGVYLVLSGQVELTKTAPGDNRIAVLATVPEGEYFGEMGVIDDCGRSTGARTLGETRLAKIPAAPLMDILRREPGEVCLHFMRRISEYLRATNSRFVGEILRKGRLQLVGEMASSIIHDFSNPMTSIQLAVELLSKQRQDKEVVECCQLMKEQVERMVAMAEELLDYSRGELRLNKETTTVKALFEKVEFLNRHYLQKNNVALRLEAVDAPLKVDTNRMLRVIQNLLNNAVQAFGPDGGTVHFQAEKPDEHTVELRISDNGPGVPERVRETLFEPFVTEGKRRSTGLGLAIVKRIVEAHEGAISFVTKTGKGTTFTIRLPTST